MKTSVRSRILSFAAAALLTGGLATSMVEAAIIVVDDFEGYADTAALQANWTFVGSNPLTANVVPRSLDTSVAHTGSQSMRIDYNVSCAGGAPCFGQVRTPAPIPVPVQNNWSNHTQLEFWYLGQETNSLDRLSFRIGSIFGGEIVNVPFPYDQTRVTKWTRGVLDFSTFTAGQIAQLDEVGHVRIGLAGVGGATPSDFGSGVIWIDDIRVIPEPTALGLAVLGACGCLLRRRRLL
jgi:hypothetical protein